MYRRVLVPLDGSELSRQALRHAVMIARAGNAEVLLVQVVDSEAQLIAQTTPATIEPIPPGRVTAEVVREAVVGQRQAALENLESAAEQLRAEGIESVRTEILEGPPGEAITEAVERFDCDLVVMATHGRSGIRRAVLGSVADYIVRHTPTAPVLLVRPELD